MKVIGFTTTTADSKPGRPNRSGLSGQLATWAGNLLTSPMNAGIKFRLVTFVLAIALVFAGIVIIAHTSWQRIDELRKRLTSVQLESFLIAEHFQKSILDLNNSLLRYEIRPDPAEWNYFHSQSVELNSWIDEQFKQFGSRISPTETNLLRQLDAAYDDYLRAATNLQVTESRPRSPADALLEFSSVKQETDKLLQLGIALAGAHRDTLNSFVVDSNHSLANLRAVLLTLLSLLLLFGAGLASVTYRDLIAPLRVKLVESHALLERQEKLASLGMLAAGVAHEIRNPLTAIKARLFTQQKVLKAGSPEQIDAEVIGHEINRLERIVKDVLLFARPSEPEFVVVPAGEPLRQVEALLGKQLSEADIRLIVEERAGAFIRIDLQQLQQVLINLVQNAADSIGQNGSITLRTRTENLRRSERMQSVVVLEVADTGKGISPEVEKRLFDPFFTTKDAGTGLGLPIAARIVEKHGGSLSYQTQVGHGTTFGIVLPRVEPT
jgi:signal transduction histidine kinase